MKKEDVIHIEEILADQKSADELLEVPLAEAVFKFFLGLTLVVGILMTAELINLGILKSSFYKKRALVNASEIEIQPAPRGIIFDRFQKPLLQNAPSFNVFLVPAGLARDSSIRADQIKRIGEVLNMDPKTLIEKIRTKNWDESDRIFLANNLSYDAMVNLVSENLPGLKLEPAFERIHAPPFKFAHVLGYTGLVDDNDLETNKNLTAEDEIGRTGLEAYYDSYLRGKNGETVFFKTATGELKGQKYSRPPQSGAALETFLDKDFQEYFYDRLEEALRNLHRDSGAGIALNPKNGEVLALFSIPSFDASAVHKFLALQNQPLFNRAISGLYSPGSTIKPLHAVAALAEGIIRPENQIYSAGFIEIPNPYFPNLPSRFMDWKPHGWVNLYGALARSSNVYFYEIGGGFQNQKGLGIEKIKKWWQKFRLENKTGIDLVGEKSGFLPDPVWMENFNHREWKIGDTYNVSIGQGDLLVTPIGLLNYIAALANGGKFYKPRVAKAILDNNGKILLQNEPQLLADLSEELKSAIEEVKRGMEDAVEKPYGTAHLLVDLPMKVAAKTGSAQTDNNTKTNAFFVGYAPADDPQIAILILVENAKEGSLNVVPVAKSVLAWYYENRIKNKNSN